MHDNNVVLNLDAAVNPGISAISTASGTCLEGALAFAIERKYARKYTDGTLRPFVTTTDVAQFVALNYTSCVKLLYNRLNSLTDEELRLVDYVTILSMTHLEHAFNTIYCGFWPATELYYKYRFQAAIRGIKSNQLSWRVQGAKELSSMVGFALNNEKAERKGFWMKPKQVRAFF